MPNEPKFRQFEVHCESPGDALQHRSVPRIGSEYPGDPALILTDIYVQQSKDDSSLWLVKATYGTEASHA
jgi:hypothetical protein